MIKRVFTLALLILGAATAVAQNNIPETHMTSEVVAARRTEIVLPKVNGLTFGR